MIITNKLLDELTEKAKSSPRLRLGMDLRNTPEDNSQRMLNALEPGTIMPIHRHKDTSETCVCVRGHFEEYFYDEKGNLTETVYLLRHPHSERGAVGEKDRATDFVGGRLGRKHVNEVVICWDCRILAYGDRRKKPAEIAGTRYKNEKIDEPNAEKGWDQSLPCSN